MRTLNLDGLSSSEALRLARACVEAMSLKLMAYNRVHLLRLGVSVEMVEEAIGWWQERVDVEIDKCLAAVSVWLAELEGSPGREVPQEIIHGSSPFGGNRSSRERLSLH